MASFKNAPNSALKPTRLRRAAYLGEEAGLLLYEDWSERKSGFIYEIFILSSFRKKGLGTLLLLYAEKHAIQLNCDVLRLKPYALAQEPDNILLRNWYEKNGYQQYTKDCEFMTKYLKSPILSINF